jgi:hypothetical protein
MDRRCWQRLSAGGVASIEFVKLRVKFMGSWKPPDRAFDFCPHLLPDEVGELTGTPTVALIVMIHDFDFNFVG